VLVDPRRLGNRSDVPFEVFARISARFEGAIRRTAFAVQRDLAVLRVSLLLGEETFLGLAAKHWRAVNLPILLGLSRLGWLRR
jgi:hypothetical protein